MSKSRMSFEDQIEAYFMQASKEDVLKVFAAIERTMFLRRILKRQRELSVPKKDSQAQVTEEQLPMQPAAQATFEHNPLGMSVPYITGLPAAEEDEDPGLPAGAEDPDAA